VSNEQQMYRQHKRMRVGTFLTSSQHLLAQGKRVSPATPTDVRSGPG
jgi:hypothetical protein